MFQRFNNLESAFQYIRGFCGLFLLCSTLLSGYALYSAHRLVDKSEQKIYVLANNKAIEAYASDRKENIVVEGRDHVRAFHHYFFTLDPDDKAIEANLNKALYLADRSAKEQYDNLKENAFYANIISGNISQTVVLDTIEVNTKSYPFYFRCRGRQQIIRPTTTTTRSLLTDGYLRHVARSDNNPHGFLIERWRILENRDLSTQNR